MRAISLIILVALAGCQPNVVYVNNGSPMRLGETVRAQVEYESKDAAGNRVWTKSGNKVELPEGWYVVPPPTTPTGK
jgi:hypothetical protein